MQRREPHSAPPRVRRHPRRSTAPPKSAADEWSDLDEGVEPRGYTGFAGRVIGTLCFRFLVPVVLLVVLAIGGGYFRLLQGPASLKFLIEPVEQGISAELNGITPKVEDVVVTLGSGGGLEFRLLNLRLFEAGLKDGGLLAAVPSAAMQLSASALWTGRVVPSSVEFIEPQLFLAYSPIDGLTLKFSHVGGEGQVLDGLSGPPQRAFRDGSNPRAVEDAAGGWRAQVSSDAVVTPKNEPDNERPPQQIVTQQIVLAKMLTEASARARESGNVSSYLREIGFRDATVVLDRDGRQSTWNVPRISMVLDHTTAGSILSGQVTVASRRGPWGLSFRLEDALETNSFGATLAVRGLVPRSLGEALPELGLLRPLDFPVDGDAALVFSRDGQLGGGRFKVTVGHGKMHLPTISAVPLVIDAGDLNVTYDANTKRIEMQPSQLRWGESSATLVGVAIPDEANRQAGAETPWRFEVRAQDGVLSDSALGLQPVQLETWNAVGSVLPSQSIVNLEALNIAAGGAQIIYTGEFDSSTKTPGFSLDGKLTSVPVGTLAMLWPQGTAAAGRKWVARSISAGEVTTGTTKYLSGRHLRAEQPAGERNYRFALAGEFSNVKMRLSDGAPEFDFPRGLVRLENSTLEIVTPEASVAVGDQQSVHLTKARYTAVNLDQPQPVSEVAFKIESEASHLLALLEHPSVQLRDSSSHKFDSLEGKIAGDIKLTFPVSDSITARDVIAGGKLRLSDGRAKNVFGEFDMQGATVDFDISENAIGANGEILLSGVLAKVNWQHIFAAQSEQQPPLRLTASLDKADRKQLGIELGDSVEGTVPLEVTIAARLGNNSAVHVRADLTNADLFIDAIAWHKRPGRSAHVEFDLEAGTQHPTMLRNLKVAGDDIGIEGSAGMDKNNRIVAFNFPNFSLDLVSRLKVSGRRTSAKVWTIDASGPTYDGRAIFSSLFKVGQISGRPVHRVEPDEGLNLKANIGNVLGHGDVALKDLSLKMSRRGGKLSGLKVDGTLSNGAPLTVRYTDAQGSARAMVADSSDAGEVFRLVGFYPNIRGGKMRLDVQLDGRGAAEKTGTLFVEKFQILGDPVVSEVFSNIQDGQPSIAAGHQRGRQVVREVFPFDRMRAPFSVGHGQFVLQDAYLKGPVLGATLRGKVDYTNRTLNIGGTYVPLQGLNNVFGEIPVLGELLSGPRSEGLFGMTFAIQGAMARPQVIVNPLSFVAPGILREIFQLTPNAPQVQPRAAPKQGGVRTNWNVRSSSAPAVDRNRDNGSTVVDGWTARSSGE